MRKPKGRYIGVLCRRNHRYDKSNQSMRNKKGDCLECARFREKEYYQNNKEEVDKRSAAYYKKNKKAINKRRQKKRKDETDRNKKHS